MDPETARAILPDAARVLDTTGVTWWLYAGTFLGAYRDGLSDAFLALDSDLDFAVLGNDRADQVRQALQKNGYDLYVEYSGSKGPVQLAVRKDGIIVDVYFQLRVGDELQVETNVQNLTIWEPARFIEPLGEIVLAGTRYPAPNDPVGYLEHRYGPDWKTPVPRKTPWMDYTPCVRTR